MHRNIGKPEIINDPQHLGLKYLKKHALGKIEIRLERLKQKVR